MPQTHCIHENSHLVRLDFMQICRLGITGASYLALIVILAGRTQAGDAELEKLKQGLQSPTEAARVDAIRKLKISEAEAGKAAEVLVPLLADKSVPVQQAASSALVKLGARAIPALSTALKNDPQPEVRSAAIRLLAQSIRAGPEGKEFHEPLLLALGDKDWSVRRSAGLALTKAGTHAAPGLIEVVEKSPLPGARAEAILALGMIGQGAKTAIKPLIEVIRDPKHGHLHTQALAALANMNPEAGAALLGLFDDRDSGVRVMAINTLTADQARTAKDALLKMLRDPSEEVRQASAKALARSGADILQDVEPLLTDPQADTRAAAIQAIGPSATVATLGKFLRDEGIVAQQAGVVFLAKRGSDAFPTLIEALRSKNFRAERAAARTIALVPDRADDLIPVLVEVLLAKETQEPEAVAKTILRVNPTYGARLLAQQAQAPELIRLLKKAGFLEKEIPAVQELACLALAERGASARDALPALTELLKNPRTEVGVLGAAARAVNAIGPKDSAYRVAPDLIRRVVQGTHEKSRLLRGDGMSNLMRVGLKAETFEVILAMLSLDVDADEANEWIIHHANASNSWNLAGPNLVRILALFHSRSKLGPRRLTPDAEEALQAHLWRYLQQALPGKSPGILPRPLGDVSAVLPIDNLAWMTSAYLALDVLKDDPEYKDRKIQGRTPGELYQDWTTWWRAWAKHRALNGLWSEMGFTNHQTFIWPNLLNMVDLASDPVVKQRFRMLLDLTMIEEEQISMQGTRAGRRGKQNEVGSNLDPWKDLLFGEEPRRFADANINYRGIYWTTTYKLPPAAILLRKLNRPESHYAITNHHFHGGAVFAFAAPHYILGSQISQPKGSMEFPGAWHRLVFDDMNAVLFPLTEGGRQHVQYRNVYITRFAGSDHPAIDFTAALKIVEKDGWIFVSNGPAFAGIHFDGGYRLERSGRKELGRQNCDSLFSKTPQSTILLHAGDVQTHSSFEKFQDAILKAPLTSTETSLRYTGPNMPAIEFFREPGKASLIAGTPQPSWSEGKVYDSPYLLGEAGQARITVRVGQYSAVYDFELSAIMDEKGFEK
jgi:HEAT repeat protein